MKFTDLYLNSVLDVYLWLFSKFCTLISLYSHALFSVGIMTCQMSLISLYCISFIMKPKKGIGRLVSKELSFNNYYA